MNKKILSVFIAITLLLSSGLVSYAEENFFENNLHSHELSTNYPQDMENCKLVKIDKNIDIDFEIKPHYMELYSNNDKDLFDCGSTYAYFDLIKRSNSYNRIKLYDDLNSMCKDFATDTQDVPATNDGNIIGTINISNYNLTDNEIYEVYFMFCHDHPEYYWLSNEVLITSSYISNNKVYVKIYEDYALGVTRLELKTQITKTIKKYEELVHGMSSKFDIALTLHNAMIDDTNYGDENTYSYNIVGILDGNNETNVVCQGYAKAYQLMLNYFDIDNVYVTGTSPLKKAGHAWNLVRMDDDEYYLVDLTWDDQPSYFRGHIHDYFMSSGKMGVTHIPDSSSGSANNFQYDLPDVSQSDYIPDYTQSNVADYFEYSIKEDGTIELSNCDTSIYGNVEIPLDIDGVPVTSIGYRCLIKCRMIKHVNINDGLNVIGPYAFSYCPNLASVTIPNSVNKVGIAAFYECDLLKDLYYGGSEAKWDKISFASYDVTQVIVHFGKESISGVVHFATGNQKAKFAYSDDFFEESSYKYNHNLARMSLRLAMSAFAKRKKSNADSYKKQYINAENLLFELHFNSIETNDAYKTIPTTDSIGVIAGSKQITFSDGDYTVIAIGIRGGNYDNEWGGNFRVGNDNYHEGFLNARNEVLRFLREYINDNEITGNVKIWITGYSRAGATANLTAGYLNNAAKTFSDKISLENKNIYAYCFEPPAGVHRDETLYDGVHKNIFNIVNENDPVPKVVMDSWDYHRYGVDKYLPLRNVPSKKRYNALRDKMLNYYKEYNGGDYKVDDFHRTMHTPTGIKFLQRMNEGIFFDDLLDELGNTIGSPSKYKSNYQDALLYVGEKIVGQKKTEPFLKKLKKNILLNTAISMNISFDEQSLSAKKSMRSALGSTFSELGIEMNEKDINSIEVLVGKMVLDGRLKIILENLDALGQGHYPELCLAWLDAIDENDLNSAPMRRMCINCPVNIEVYDEDEELVAAIYEDEVYDDSLLPVNVTTSGEKRIYLPSNGEYDIKITATGSGSVAYSVREIQEDGSVKVVSYDGIQVTSGDVLTGTAENAEETETTYPLEMNGYDISPNVETTEAVPVNISVSAEGGGSVTGGGMNYEGETVKVTAISYDGEEFLGWFSSGEFVSKDEEYDLIAAENTDLVAQFTENTCEISVSDGEKILSVQRVNKGNTVTLEKNPQRERGIFKGYYSDEGFAREFDPNTQFSENTTIYAEFEDALQYNDWYYFINEDDTASIAGCDNVRNVLNIPDKIDGHKVTSIWYASFIGESIDAVGIPESILTIGEKVFSECEYLTDIYYSGNEEKWQEITVDNQGDSFLNAVVHYDRTAPQPSPDLIMEGYCGENLEWNYYDNGELIISGEGDMLDWDDEMPPWDELEIESVIIEEGVTSVGAYAFSQCGMKDVIIPKSMTKINDSAFSDCDDLTNVCYNGTEEQWDDINIDEYNESLLEAEFYYEGTRPIPMPSPKTGFAVIYNTDSADVINNSSDDITATVIIAQYDDEGILIEIESFDFDFSSEEMISFDIDVNTRVFVWDSLTNMLPLTTE